MKKYQIIYADPPWQYRHCKTNSRKIENKYPTMTLAQIKSLNIPAEDNAVLYLWATAPKLKEALEVMEWWGFDYRSCMVWDKMVIGMGYWFRGQHELLLVGVKGKFPPPVPDRRRSSMYSEKRSKHSKKPDGIRRLIEMWYPTKSKVELFAREKTDGWDVWGNEVDSDIEL